jgi:hypothetical protein
MLLLEEWQLDILLHVLHNDVFYDMLDLFRDMHVEKCPTAEYRTFFENQTYFINFFNFPQSLVDIIKLRYKIMFLKDYIFCDYQKEEFLNYLNSVGVGDLDHRNTQFQHLLVPDREQLGVPASA